MTTSLSFHAHNAASPSSYTTQSICRCMVIHGSVPIQQMVGLMSSMPDGAVMSLRLGRRLGATLVAGLPQDLDALDALNLPPCDAIQAEMDEANRRSLPELAHWLNHGDCGASSEALAKALFGIPQSAGIAHPRDASDLARCVQLLAVTNSAHRISEAASISPEWKALVAHWDAITDPTLDHAACSERIHALTQRRASPSP